MKSREFLEVAFLGKIIRQRYGLDKDVFKYMIWLWVPPAPAEPEEWFEPIETTKTADSVTHGGITWKNRRAPSLKGSLLQCFISGPVRSLCAFCQHAYTYIGDDHHAYVLDSNSPKRIYRVCFTCRNNSEKIGYRGLFK